MVSLHRMGDVDTRSEIAARPRFRIACISPGMSRQGTLLDISFLIKLSKCCSCSNVFRKQYSVNATYGDHPLSVHRFPIYYFIDPVIVTICLM